MTLLEKLDNSHSVVKEFLREMPNLRSLTSRALYNVAVVATSIPLLISTVSASAQAVNQPPVSSYTTYLPVVRNDIQQYRIAYFGDTNGGRATEKLLNMVAGPENPVFAVVHLGDIDNKEDSSVKILNWFKEHSVNTFIFGGCGNHDYHCDMFMQFFYEQGQKFQQLGYGTMNWDYNDYSIQFIDGPIIVISNLPNSSYLEEQFINTENNWTVCVTHKPQQWASAENLDDWVGDADWYEKCFTYGGMVATGHRHYYSHTKSVYMNNGQKVIAECAQDASTNGYDACVGQNIGFAVVSGLGGHSKTPSACIPLESCPLLAQVYAGKKAEYGAFIVTYNYNKDPSLALYEFVTIEGEIIYRGYINLN